MEKGECGRACYSRSICNKEVYHIIRLNLNHLFDSIVIIINNIYDKIMIDINVGLLSLYCDV